MARERQRILLDLRRDAHISGATKTGDDSMQALLSRLPDADSFHRHRGKIAGFAAGIIVPIVAALFFQVVYTGHGIGETVVPPTPIYPNF
jgi:hypothetical protein